MPKEFVKMLRLTKKSACVIYEWPQSLLDDSDEDDIDAGPAKKSRPSNEGYFAGLPQPVKSRNIDQTSRVKTLRDNEEVTDEDSDIVSCSNTSFCFVILHSWAGLAVLFSRRILNGYSLLKFFRYETIETHALAFLTHINFVQILIGSQKKDMFNLLLFCKSLC